jgi:hypothetical protein
MNELTSEQYQKLKQAGYSQPKIEAYAASRGMSLPKEPTPGLFTKDGAVGKAVGQFTDLVGLDGATKTFGDAIARTSLGAKATGTDVNTNRQFIDQPTGKQLTGAAVQTAATALAPLIPTPAGLAAKAVLGGTLGYSFDIGQDLIDEKTGGETLLPGAGAAVGAIIPGAGPLGKGVGKAVGTAAQEAGRAVTSSPIVKGALETGIDFAERIPRFVSRRTVDLRTAAARAERIANSPAPVGNALKTGMDERIINTVEQADAPTREGYAEIIKLAEETAATDGTIKIKARPEIVAGEAASNQYKIIETKKREIGQKIGDAVQNLPNDRAVSMEKPRFELDGTLEQLGVSITKTENGTTLNFGKTGFTKEQRAKINELYELATEGGEVLTPAQIHAKDRLFSQLQREARMDKMGDILIDTADEKGNTYKTSLFQAFRDVYADTLEEVAPEIRQLNRQYRNLSTFTDDIEKTILKGGRYETNSNLDPSEFAQTNLRRLFSEASSAADYRAIADEMDKASRALGYTGANPSDLAQFAYEIRKIYPEATPRTGFEGSIKSVSDLFSTAVKLGAPDAEDQQKALRELIDFYQSAPQAGP